MAQITISSDHRLDTIVQLSGAESGSGSYDGIDTLYVESVTQEALDAALVTYMADLDTYLLEPSREIRKVRISKASANFIDEIYPSFSTHSTPSESFHLSPTLRVSSFLPCMETCILVLKSPSTMD